ncbi:(2Z,6E)-farnesyl diphosphate synthase [Geodia barretti]|uniref:Alkyl transferase n=1 Tax=Geodia barretti TaxID=519541 RepID=A0AA35R696_GEOBA|nr:(2Z,6E)-farnesyl diphosphate synthase [Geodia barretti]
MKPFHYIKNRIERFFYNAYQRRLESEANAWKIPRHIGVILDGNRRYAKASGLDDIIEGHYEGANKLEEVLHWCDELGVEVFSIWIFSLDNFKRAAHEVEGILGLIERKMRLHRNQIKVRAMGQIELLPTSLQEAIREAEEATQHYDKFILNVAVAYGGREEIIEAFRGHLKAEGESGKPIDQIADELTVDKIAPYLYTSNLPDPELIIRTSGEVRLSGFLLWQSVYSEFYFCDTYWPSFRKIDFLRALRAYSQRKRRFGK